MDQEERMRHKKELASIKIPSVDEVANLSLRKLEKLILCLFKELKDKDLFSDIIKIMEPGLSEAKATNALVTRNFILAVIQYLNTLIFDLWEGEEAEA